jgi:hypothetical protein
MKEVYKMESSNSEQVNTNKSYIITIKYGSYNDRRYSKPWIGRVIEWEVGKKPEIEWGRFCGSANHGGICEIEAYPKDIIRTGQKDFRRNWKSDNDWLIVDDNGKIMTDDEGNYVYYTESKARKHWWENHPK